jgi:stage III sporulation protein AG
VGLIGILLIFAGEMLNFDANKKSNNSPSVDENTYNEQYVQKLQADLTSFISKIEGVGQVEVLVTLETGVQYVYATNQKSTGDSAQKSEEDYSQKTSSETSVILMDGENGKEPLVLKRIEPVVQGVVVVCQGADNINVKQMVIETVSTLCGIKTNRVSVAKMP